MHRERITRDEAISAIRSNGGKSVEDVEFLILESDGTISVSLRR
ncbi:YetF domain-containing protein [Devosia algicola]